jgi:hypothetical protein
MMPGGFSDLWQREIMGIGPTGRDEGNGGKFLLLHYRLHLPPHIPAKHFWSVVAYDADSRSILRNGQSFPSVSSYTEPAVNADGSIDIDFGPEALSGAGSTKNWIQTMPGKGWFVLFRFYGPLGPFFDQSWKPDDIVELT